MPAQAISETAPADDDSPFRESSILHGGPLLSADNSTTRGLGLVAVLFCLASLAIEKAPVFEQLNIRSLFIVEDPPGQRTRAEIIRGVHAQLASVDAIRTMKRAYNLTDQQLAEILKSVWQQDPANADKTVAPWSFTLGNMDPDDWWTIQTWDAERVRQAIENAH